MAISIFFVSLTQMLVRAKLKGLGTKHCELTSRSNKQLAAYQHSHPERLGQISKIWKLSLRRQQKSPVVMRTKGAKIPVLVFYCCGNNHKCGSLKNRYYLTVMQKSEWSHWDKIDVSRVALEALGKNPFLCLPGSQRLLTLLGLWLSSSILEASNVASFDHSSIVISLPDPSQGEFSTSKD